MVQQQVTVENASGLHARPAALFVQTAGKFASKIRIATDTKEVDAKSILGILSLGAHKGKILTLRAEGADEVEAVANLVALLQSRFGEG
jgi:phosphocarrier protein HPr